jgi:hypothetical protein
MLANWNGQSSLSICDCDFARPAQHLRLAGHGKGRCVREIAGLVLVAAAMRHEAPVQKIHIVEPGSSGA